MSTILLIFRLIAGNMHADIASMRSLVDTYLSELNINVFSY
jgi:hypothetical protein